jgi:TPR repeat protein
MEAFSQLSGVPLPKTMTPEGKRKAMEDALDWLRKAADAGDRRAREFLADREEA